MSHQKKQQRVFVIGVGMTKFEKPGSREWDYPDMARESGTAALKDAGVSFDQIEEAFAGYVYGDSCAGERAARTTVRNCAPEIHPSTVTAAKWILRCAIVHHRSRLRRAPG